MLAQLFKGSNPRRNPMMTVCNYIIYCESCKMIAIKRNLRLFTAQLLRWTHVEQCLLLRQLARAFLQHPPVPPPCALCGSQTKQCCWEAWRWQVVYKWQWWCWEQGGSLPVGLASLSVGFWSPRLWFPLNTSATLFKTGLSMPASCCQLHSPSQTHCRHSWLQR